MKQNARYILLGIVLILGLSLAAVTVLGETSLPPGPETEIGGVAGQDDNAAAQGPDRSVAGGPGFMMVNPLQFRPYESTYQWAYLGANLYNPGSTAAVYEAALTLPDKVTITKVVAYYYDNSPNNISIRMYRCFISASNCDSMSQMTSSGASTDFRYQAQNVIAYSVIDQQNYSYIIELYIPAAGTNLRLTGVRIDYANTSYLPLIQQYAP